MGDETGEAVDDGTGEAVDEGTGEAVDDDAGRSPAGRGPGPAGPTEPAGHREAVQSDWWYVPAAVVAWGAVLTAVLALSGVVTPLADAAEPVALVGAGLLLVLPAALYVDGGRIADAGGEWAPSRTLYAVGAVGGVLLPPVGVGVAALYLYRRHRFVGVP